MRPLHLAPASNGRVATCRDRAVAGRAGGLGEEPRHHLRSGGLRFAYGDGDGTSEGDARLRSKHRATDLTGEAKGEPVGARTGAGDMGSSFKTGTKPSSSRFAPPPADGEAVPSSDCAIGEVKKN